MDTQPSGGGIPAAAADPWRRIAPAHSWPDLVLPAPEHKALRAIATRLRARARRAANGGASTGVPGPLVLFAGPVGTGKTMAARIIGGQLRRPILEVDTTALRAKDRAGLEEIIGRAFSTAEAENAILYFEHADAVLSERPLPRSRQARPGKLTAPDLFDRAERHPGLVIFASTLTGRIDPAYRNRFASVIEFPFPDRDARERIWRRLLPSDAQLRQADIEYLADSFQLPGATIASCCAAAITAAGEQDAPVTLLHVAEAIQAEYRGRLASESTLAAVRALIAGAREAHGDPTGDSRIADSGIAEDVGGAQNGAHRVPAPIQEEVTRRPPPPEEAMPLRPRRKRDEVPARPRPAKGKVPLISGPTRKEAPPKPRPAPPARPPQAERTPLARQAGSGLISLGAVIVAIAIGFGVARLATGSQPAGASQATAGPIHVSLPPGWRRVSAQVQSLGLTNGLMVERQGSPRLTIGTLPPGDPAVLPGPVLAALHSVPPPQIAKLGSLSFYRYPNLVTVPGGSVESVYATPTTIGTLVGVCTTPAAGTGAASACERVLSTVRLASGRILGTASGTSYVTALNAVITKLNASLTQLGAQLASARTAATQASAASQLAAADSSAALAASTLNPGLASAVNSKLVAALQASAAAYGALARAAQQNDATAFAAGRASVASAQAAVNSALLQLSALGGYRIG